MERSRFGVAVAPRTAAEPTGLQQPWPRAPGSPRSPLVFLFFILMLLNYENPSCSSSTARTPRFGVLRFESYWVCLVRDGVCPSAQDILGRKEEKI